jgi:hypothetical protein
MLPLLLAATATGTGGALVAYFVTGLALPVGIAGAVGAAATAWAIVWPRLSRPVQAEVSRRSRIGLVAGVPAVIGYDVSRWLLVTMTGSSVRPFVAWGYFGELLGAGPHTTVTAVLAGAAYHVVNGLAFAVAYAIVLGHRGILAGIAWAMVLETFMVTFYPGWLGLKALQEFVGVTVLGHVVYGTVLGVLARRLVLRRRIPT